MKWEKAPEELKVLLERVMTGIDCEKRSMFGYPAYFINQNMFAGLFQTAVFMRLSPDQLSRLTKIHPSISQLEPMPGRPMKNHYAIPEDLYRNEEAFKKVAAEAAVHAYALAPKEKPAARKKAPTEKNKAAPRAGIAAASAPSGMPSAMPVRKKSPPKKAAPGKSSAKKRSRGS